MHHNLSLISTLAAAFSVAIALGYLAERMKMPALVGYLMAGIVIGPATPGFVADLDLAAQLSEIGVMLLMFGVGLHFSLDDLLAVKRIAIPGAIAQMTAATALGMAAAWVWGWPPAAAMVFGLSLSCASTVVLLKALEARNILESANGQIAVGWLVVEDLATVLILVLLPPLAGALEAPSGGDAPALWMTLGQTLLQVFAFIALMLVVGRRVLPWLLWLISQTGSRELFTLAVIAAAIGIAYGAAHWFSVSFALGAFFAGMVMRESKFSHRAAEESLPLRDAFSVLFFVSVGMLFEPSILIEQPVHLLVVLAIVVFGKALAALAIVLLFGYPFNTALIVSASLAQIGEFSFILGGLGVSLGLMPAQGMSLVLAGALFSIAINPVVFALVQPLREFLVGRSALARLLDRKSGPFAELPMTTERKYLEGQVVLVGYGRVGRRIIAGLRARGIPCVVAEQNRDRVRLLRDEGVAAVEGDAADPAVLIQAHIAHAAILVIAVPDVFDIHPMIATARALNPTIEIVVRAHDEQQSEWFRREQVGTVFFGEEALADSMTTHVVGRFAGRPVAS